MPKNSKNQDDSDIEKELEEAMKQGEPQREERLPKTDLEKDLAAEIKNEQPEEGKQSFASRFYELSGKPFKTEADLNVAVNDILDDVEKECFFRELPNTKKAGKLLLQKGLEVYPGASVLQAARDLTQLTRGNLKGTLGSLAKTAVKSIREGASIPPVLGDVGFEPRAGTEQIRAAWQNFASLCEESYSSLALNLNENADDPVEAGRLAFKAFGTALKKVQSERKFAAVPTTTKRMGEEPRRGGKVVSRTVALVLGLICIILAASLITAVAFYLPTSNEINRLNTQIQIQEGNITALTQQNSALQGALNQISSQLATKDAQILDLNSTVTELRSMIQSYLNIIYLNVSSFLANNQGLTISPNANTTIWNDYLDYAGYVTVQVQSSSNTTYVQLLYSTLGGVNFDQTVVLGTSGTTALPVLPATVQIRIGNTEPVDSVNGTVTVVYHY